MLRHEHPREYERLLEQEDAGTDPVQPSAEALGVEPSDGKPV
jgi:hypothetical protein